MSIPPPDQALKDVDVLLSRSNLAHRWRCSISTIKRMEQHGTIRPIRISARTIRFKLQDIEEIEQTRR